jgi:hypothetical protein
MPSPLVKSHTPICSVERAKELGFDLAAVATCAAPNPAGKVRGCPVWDSCRFDRPEYGGFKGTRPHFIGYYLRAIDGGAKRDVCACFSFINTLQPRMDDGMAMRLKGESRYETVKIVAQEGEVIELKKVVPAPPSKDGQMKWVKSVTKNAVPEFPDPTSNDPFLVYEAELIAQENEDIGSQTFAPQMATSRPVAEPVVPKR